MAAPIIKTPWSAPAPPAPAAAPSSGFVGGGAAANPWNTNAGMFSNIGSNAGAAPVQPKPGDPGYAELLKLQQDWVDSGGSVAPGMGSPMETHGPDPAGWALDVAKNQSWVDSGGSVAPGMGAPVDPTRAPMPTGPGTLSGPGAAETTFAEHGGEFFKPGPAQDFYSENKSAFTQPTNTGQYFNKISGQTAPQVENRADQAFDTYQREMPGFIDAPDLGTFYDFAEEQSQRSLADAQAARGVFGSSVASGQAGDLSRGLRADQANREADYNLARNADRRQTLLGLSGAGRAGDLTDLGNADNEMTWRAMLGDLAGRSDAASLGRLGLGVGAAANAGDERLRGLSGGMSAAGVAQGAEEGREGGALSDLQGFWSMLSSLAGGTYGDINDTDAALMDGEISGGVAGATNAYNMDETRQGKFVAELTALLEAIKSGQPVPGAG